MPLLYFLNVHFGVDASCTVRSTDLRPSTNASEQWHVVVVATTNASYEAASAPIRRQWKRLTGREATAIGFVNGDRADAVYILENFGRLLPKDHVHSLVSSAEELCSKHSIRARWSDVRSASAMLLSCAEYEALATALSGSTESRPGSPALLEKLCSTFRSHSTVVEVACTSPSCHVRYQNNRTGDDVEVGTTPPLQWKLRTRMLCASSSASSDTKRERIAPTARTLFQAATPSSAPAAPRTTFFTRGTTSSFTPPAPATAPTLPFAATSSSVNEPSTVLAAEATAVQLRDELGRCHIALRTVQQLLASREQELMSLKEQAGRFIDQQLAAARETLRQQLQQAEQEARQRMANAGSWFAKEKEGLEAKLTILLAEKDKMHAENDELYRKVKRLQIERDRARSDVERLRAALSHNPEAVELDSVRIQLEAALQAKHDAEERASSAVKETGRLQLRLAKATREAREATQQLASKNAKVGRADTGERDAHVELIRTLNRSLLVIAQWLPAAAVVLLLAVSVAALRAVA